MNEKAKKELYFINAVLGTIQNVEVPMLMYEGEKEVVRKALLDYKFKIENELYGR